MAAYYGWTLDNQGASGSQIAAPGQIFRVFDTTIVSTNKYSWMTGYNDMRYFGNSASDIGYFQGTLYAGLVWLGFPDGNKKTGQGGSVTTTGTWSNSDVYSDIGIKSSTQNDKVEFTTTGDVLYVVSTKVDGGTGEFDVIVDSNNKGTYNCYDAPTIYVGSDYQAFLVRISGLGAGSHDVEVKVTSASGTVYFDFATGIGDLGATKPYIMVGGCLYMTNDGYAAGSPDWDNGSDAAVDAFNTSITQAVNVLAVDGLNIALAQVNDSYNLETDVSEDDVHPNDSGHQHIADEFNNIEATSTTTSTSSSTSSTTTSSSTSTTTTLPHVLITTKKKRIYIYKEFIVDP